MANAIILSLILVYAQIVLTIRIPLRRVARKAEGANLQVSLPLTHFNWDYYGDITVGTAREGEKEQVFSVLFDTGSLNLWIASIDATNEEDRRLTLPSLFDPSKSTTFKKRKKPFEILYGDKMMAKGHLAEDTIKIEFKKKVFILKNQVFGLTEQLKNRNIDRDGVFGLGLMQQSFEGNPDPPFITMAKQNGMEPVFGFYFNRDKDGLNGGELSFGGENENLVEGEFTYHNVIKIFGFYDHWYLNVNKITTGDHELQLLNMLTLIDTGNNVISGPKVLVDSLNQILFKDASFEVSKDFIFSCGVNWIELPDVAIVLDDISYVLTAEDYVWGLKYLNEKTCGSVFHGVADRTYFTLGQPFMEKYYTKFDMGRKRIGFARAKTPY